MNLSIKILINIFIKFLCFEQIYYFYGKIAQAGIKISLTGVFRSGLFFIPILSM